MRHFAVVGSGRRASTPLKHWPRLRWCWSRGRRRASNHRPLSSAYGLILRCCAGSPSLKAVAKRYDKVAETPGVGLAGVTVGADVSVHELLTLYDAVILAIGAPHDRKLGIPGEDLPGVIGSAQFVGWYNGHPDFADLNPPLDGTHAAVIGNGNVALDCARILSKSRNEFTGSDIVGHALEALDRSAIKTITILGRRGPHQIAMTPKELGELAHLEAALPIVDLGDFGVETDDRWSRAAQIGQSCAIRQYSANRPRRCSSISSPAVALEGEGRERRSSSARLGERGARGTDET